MIVLDSIDAFALRYHGEKKWVRCLEAFARAPGLRPGVCHSIGDSLVYRLVDGPAAAAPCFTGHRRYVEIHHYLDGGETIAYSPKGLLASQSAYSDETDRETFAGQARHTHVARAGQVLVFDNAFAYAPAGTPSLRKSVLLVTIEGGGFHNK